MDEATGIDESSWRQMEDERLRLFIDLAHKRHWGYYVEYGWRGQMRIVVKHPPKIDDAQMPLKIESLLLMLDMAVGVKVRWALLGSRKRKWLFSYLKETRGITARSGAKVIMTRTDDSYLYME